MKKIKILFILFILISLTGCLPHRRAKQISLFGDEDLNGGEISSVKKDALSWIGKYNLNDKDTDAYIYLSLEAGSTNISLDLVCNSYTSDTEEGLINNFSFTTYLESFDKEIINISDSYLGISGTIEKTDDGFIVNIASSENKDYEKINGTYKHEKNSTDIKGYYSNSNGTIAISPQGSDYARVSSNISNGEDTYSISLFFDVIGDKLVYDDMESATIEKTDDGISITSDIPNFAGEYTKEN